MKRIIFTISMLFFVQGTRLDAKVLTLTPVEHGAGTALSTEQTATVSQSGVDGSVAETQTPLAEAYLKFDLTNLVGRPINMVSFEWSVEGVFADSVTSYDLYAVPQSANPYEGTQLPSTSEDDLVAVWNLAPIDIVRNEGAAVLFDLTDLVKQWLSGDMPNKGVVIKTRALSDEGLRQQLSRAKLVVR